MKYWYLRPRQDYTIARLAKVLKILDYGEYDVSIFNLHEKGDDKPVLCIALRSYLYSRVDVWSANRAVRRICEHSDAVDRDFKVLYFEFPDDPKKEVKE